MRLGWLPLIVLVGCSSGDDLFGRPIPLPSAPAPAPGLAPRDVQLLGSYELAFDNVASELPPASIGNRARLDIREGSGATLFAHLTPRWGEHHAFTKTELGYDEIVLDDYFANANPSTFVSASGESNEWRRFRLPRRADGTLDGTFRAIDLQGREGRGTLKEDTLAPEVALEPPLVGHGGKYLPWETLIFKSAEPLSLRSWAKAAPDLSFPAGMNDVVLVTAWQRDVLGTTRDLAITALKDPAGNPVVPFQTQLNVHAVGAPRERHDFDDGAALAMWGGAERVADARCEKGGCVVFPAALQTKCNPAGIAGVFSMKGKLAIHAKVRVLASDKDDILPPIVLTTSDTPEIPRAATALGSYDFAQTGSSALPYETPWKTLSITFHVLPVDKLGFSIVRAGCGSKVALTGSESQVSVIIDDVWME